MMHHCPVSLVAVTVSYTDFVDEIASSTIITIPFIIGRYIDSSKLCESIPWRRRTSSIAAFYSMQMPWTNVHDGICLRNVQAHR